MNTSAIPKLERGKSLSDAGIRTMPSHNLNGQRHRDSARRVPSTKIEPCTCAASTKGTKNQCSGCMTNERRATKRRR
jgi:hypothetical protein